MPIRIKPTHDLGPCSLTLDSITNIISRVEQDFPDAFFNAADGTWEIYDEPAASFRSEVSQREALDSFVVRASSLAPDPRQLMITFDREQATASLIAPPVYLDWFEHFLHDLRKHVLKPAFNQIVVHGLGATNLNLGLSLAVPLLFVTLPIRDMKAPYCRIIIRKRPPNPFIENIKANLVSSLIWAILAFLVGILVTLISTGELKLW